MRHCIILGLIILLASCASNTNYYGKTMKSWQGANAHNLTKKWGQPDQMTVGQNGHAYLTYKTTSYRPGFAGPVSPLTFSGSGRTMTLSCTAIFEVNQKRTIVGTQYMGTGCFGSENFAQRMSA